MDKMQAYNAFWNSFSLKAYDENSVPDGAQLPYITYEAATDDFGGTLALTVNLWYRSSSWVDITNKVQEIEDFITRGGRMVAYDNGAMWIQKARPFSQRLNEPSDESIRRIVLNVSVEFLS